MFFIKHDYWWAITCLTPQQHKRRWYWSMTPGWHQQVTKSKWRSMQGKKKNIRFFYSSIQQSDQLQPQWTLGAKKKILLSVRTESIVFGAVFKVYFFPIFFICPVSIICILICWAQMCWEESVLKRSIFKWKEYLTPNFGVNRFADDTGLNHYYY